MADQNEQPSTYSHPEQDLQLQQHEEHQNQCDNSEAPSSSEGTTEEAKSITNIYYDCLERIFDFLDLESLLNVAQTCKRLQIAAIAKFGDDYGGASVINFRNVGHRIHKSERNQETLYHISGLKLALPYLRCFGAKISHLYLFGRINYGAAKEAYLYEYIYRYCANSLTQMNFCANGIFFNQSFPMQFVKVETVGVCWHDNIDVPNIANCFPNTRTLKISGAFIDDSMPIVSIPHLKYLILQNVTMENAAKLLRANPQLQRLDLTFAEDITFDRLVNVFDGNSSISELDINGILTNMNEVNLNRFVIQCPKIKVLFFTCSFSADLAFILISQLRSLERFEFDMSGRSDFNRLVSRMENAWNHSLHFDDGEVTYTNLVNKKT